MPQVSRFPLKREVWEKISGLFFQALVAANNKKAAQVFVEGFLAPTERVMLAKRFAVLFLLEKGVEGAEIANFLKMSTSTVSRLRLWQKNLDAQQRELLRRILLKREVKNLLIDILKTFLYEGPPPKGADWKKRGQEKWRWEMEQKEPLR